MASKKTYVLVRSEYAPDGRTALFMMESTDFRLDPSWIGPQPVILGEGQYNRKLNTLTVAGLVYRVYPDWSVKPLETKPAALEVSINGERLPVVSLREAQSRWTAYRDQNGISSDMGRHDGKVFQGKKLVARVSYNGRLWAPDGQEITLPCDVAL